MKQESEIGRTRSRRECSHNCKCARARASERVLNEMGDVVMRDAGAELAALRRQVAELETDLAFANFMLDRTLERRALAGRTVGALRRAWRWLAGRGDA